MRQLRMVMALDRVDHGLSDAMPGLEATQKTSPIIGTRLPITPTSSGYTESVMVIPQNIRTTPKEFLSALSCKLLYIAI